MTPVLIAVIALAAFAVFWVVLLGGLARLTGWAALAERYRTGAPPIQGRRSTWESIRLRSWGNYNACLTLVFSPQGLYLVPFRPFRFGHAPLLIPWSALRFVRNERIMGTDCVRLEVAAAGNPIPLTLTAKTWDLGAPFRS